MEVRREGDTVRIEGIRGFSPAEFASSVHGSQARILKAVGEDLTYDDLVCYSGFAFRVGVSDRMCPSAGHPCCGYDCLEPGIPAIPWKMKLYQNLPWEGDRSRDEGFREEVYAAVKASIDRGIPVHYGSEEDGLIIGYSGEGKRWLCIHPYHRWGAETFWHDEAAGFAGGKWPWGIAIWQEPGNTDDIPSDDELLRKALEQAVDMWSAGKQEDQYLCGDEAYSFWIDWLKGVNDGSVEDPASGMQGNGWCYDVLVHSRRIASEWLRKRAEELQGEAGELLSDAAESYRELADVLMAGLDCPWELALAPEKFDEWTPEMRSEEVRRLERARDLDAQAVESIRRALETMD